MDWQGIFLALIGWVQARGPEAALWLFALQVVQVVLAVPGPFFTMGAGMLLGTVTGSLVAVSGSTTGAVVAYALARYARGRRAGGSGAESSALPGRWASNPRLEALGRFVMGGGWRIVLSSRLIPGFPFKLSNYFFGWARYPFASFFWGTFLGIAPLTIVSVSAGALATDIAMLSRSGSEGMGNSWMLSLGVFAVAALLLAWAGWRARAGMRAGSGRKEAGG